MAGPFFVPRQLKFNVGHGLGTILSLVSICHLFFSVVKSRRIAVGRRKEDTMKRKMIMFVFMILYPSLVLGADRLPAAGEERYDGFKKIESFAFVYVTAQGSAPEIGIDQDDYTDRLRYLFKTTIAGMDVEKPSNLSEIMTDLSKAAKYGVLIVNVTTVGHKHPIPYHIDFYAGSLANYRIYNATLLGYNNEYNVPRIVREKIEEFMEKFAIVFLKAREEL